jgi:CheY-like chemotaxis protein
VIQVNHQEVHRHLDQVVRKSVDATLNALLEAEADELCGARPYQRSAERLDARAGHHTRRLHTRAWRVEPKVPKLRNLPFETAIIGGGPRPLAGRRGRPRHARVAATGLSLRGCVVREAADGPRGLRLALGWRPDAFVSDLGLPRLDGRELGRRVRAALGGVVLIVALSGYGADEDHRRSLEAGFDHHLVKPADPAQLLRLPGVGA